MDHESEQQMEMEALEAIFMDELQEDDGNQPEGWSRHATTYCIGIRPSEEAGPVADDGTAVEAELLFAHTAAYPEEPPSVRLRSVKGLSDADLAAAMAVVNQQIEENLGMAMVYQIFTAVQEWLTERQQVKPAADPDQERRKAEEAAEAARAAARAHGTPVTEEAFRAWKKKFDEEQAALRQAAAEASGKAADDRAVAGRLTGRQWFTQPREGDAVDDGSAISEGSDADGLSDYEPGQRSEGGEEDEDDPDFDPDADEDDDDDEDFLDDFAANLEKKGG